MSNHVLLDNVTHKDLRVITDRSPQYGDEVTFSGVFASEFRRVQAEYPIVFKKRVTTGQIEPVAMFGLAERENLFLGADGWGARYVPLTIQRQPFLIGFQSTSEQGVPTEKPVIHVDMDSPRLSVTEGEAVFLEHGGNSPYLERMNSVLATIHDGHEYNKGFVAALEEFGLLEPFALEVTLNDGSKHRLAGFHTIAEQPLNALNGEALARLHAAGYLEQVYMAMASLANFANLIERKNARL